MWLVSPTVSGRFAGQSGVARVDVVHSSCDLDCRISSLHLQLTQVSSHPTSHLSNFLHTSDHAFISTPKIDDDLREPPGIILCTFIGHLST
jgi:hypothetical protein